MFRLLLACTPDPTDTSKAPVESGAPESPPIETGPTPDTALGWTEYTHVEGGALDGAWLGGRLGTRFYEARTNKVACDVLGDWVDTGAAPPACPDCAWAFTLTVQDTHLEGHCDQLLVQGAREGRWDGFELPWAFSTNKEYAGEILENALLAYYNDNWLLFAYSGGDLSSWSGDAEGFETELYLDYYTVR